MHRQSAKNFLFGFRGTQNVQFYKNRNFENLAQQQYVFYHTLYKKKKKKRNVKNMSN